MNAGNKQANTMQSVISQIFDPKKHPDEVLAIEIIPVSVAMYMKKMNGIIKIPKMKRV